MVSPGLCWSQKASSFAVMQTTALVLGESHPIRQHEMGNLVGGCGEAIKGDGVVLNSETQPTLEFSCINPSRLLFFLAQLLLSSVWACSGETSYNGA